ncbi:hypothetical protein Esi_0159_0009 [Ectocarpus siliculosus]|uniref:Uncharacterized protein n=1 Tax=Ectocarpus siliculosus TaxID=2880 RepID=D7FLC1_ECTSI|nr:hypothetical protein Esi_0159_0009 [Ectocarpus siliculosus]|eukprot:CBJ29689.1 hypothetical protein Esi_0159_0009 [Ectocarpus siliculosus]
MLVGLVEEMTHKWERQLDDGGEGGWDDDMLAREGTGGDGNVGAHGRLIRYLAVTPVRTQ